MDSFKVSGGKKININTVDFLNENDLVSPLINFYRHGGNFNETIKIADLCPSYFKGVINIKKDNNKNIEGIIIGKAIYDGDILMNWQKKFNLKWLQSYLRKNLMSERAVRIIALC